MTALYLIAQEYSQAASALAELDMDAQTVADTLEGLGGDLDAKLIACAMAAANLDATDEAIGRAIAEMAARQKATRARAEAIRRHALETMRVTGRVRVISPYMTLTARENPPAVTIIDANLVPAAYWRQPETPPPSVDKTAVARSIKAGEIVPGCATVVGWRLEVKR